MGIATQGSGVSAYSTKRLKYRPKQDSRNKQTMNNFPLKATSIVGPNGKSCDGTEPEKLCTGVVTLEQPNADTITITWDIKNLGEPGSKHGFHVHEKADFSNGCKSAGPHWNPLDMDHGAPEDEIRHVGGLGNITAAGRVREQDHRQRGRQDRVRR